MRTLRKKSAFTFIELLVSMLILGIVMAAVIALMFSVFKSYELHQDITEAKQRGQLAVASIQPYILNAGLGMPAAKADFQKAFEGQTGTVALPGIMPADTAKAFKSFVQLASAKTPVADAVTEAPEVWIVYSIPSGAGVNKGYSLSAGSPAVIELDQFADLSAATNLSAVKQNLKAWVSFPATTSPFWISEIDAGNSKLTLNTATQQKIIAFDEIHLVRAVKAFVASGSILTIERLDGSGAQPAVDGIVGLWCEFDPAGDRVLTVRALARSSTKRKDHHWSGVEEWPAAASPKVADLDRQYRYAVVSRSWRIRN